MLEAWSAASLQAKCLNLACLALSFVAFVSCCVSFGGELFTARSFDRSQPTSTRPILFHFYQDRVESELGHLHFADLVRFDSDDYCTDGGRTLVAFAALGFIALTATLTLAVCRVLSVPARWLPLPAQSLRIELYLSVATGPLLLLSVALYGNLCYQHFQSNDAFINVQATGYAFSIAGVLCAVLHSCVLWYVKLDELCWLGIPEGSEYWTSKARGESDGYQEEKLSGFEQREATHADVEAGEGDEKEDEEDDRRHKRHRSKPHRANGKHRTKAMKVAKMIPMQPIDVNYEYTHTYQTSEYDTI